jgi:hypothetical protein
MCTGCSLVAASADSQELKILNLHRRSWGWGSSAAKRDDDDTSVFLVYLKTGTSCYAYSQRGLFKVEVATQRLEFRASDAREANLWIKGINSNL